MKLSIITKTFCILLISLIVFLVPLSKIYSSEELLDSKQETSDLAKEDISIEIEIGTQSPVNKSLPIAVKVTSEFDASEAYIRWSAPRDIKFLKDDEQKFTMQKNTEYEFSQSVAALSAGEFKIVVEIEAWATDANYLESESITLKFDDNLLTVPITDEYRSAATLWSIARISIAVILIIAIVFGIKLGINAFKIWLAKD